MSHYDTLGVDPNASDQELKDAYRKRARETHPDAGGSDEAFQEVSFAFMILKDPDERAYYDRFGEEKPKDTTENKALEQIQMAFMELLNKDPELQGDVISRIEEQLRMRRVDLKQARANCRNAESDSELIVNRFECDDDEIPNVLRIAIESRLNNIRRDLQKCETELQIISDAIDLLEHFKDTNPKILTELPSYGWSRTKFY